MSENLGGIFCLTDVPTFRSIADRPHNINATVGDDVVFNCNPHAVPEASIVWYKNGVQIDRKSLM